jgi:hypothetical protein
LAFGRGAALETVIDGVTGLFFSTQTPQAICEAIVRFENIEHEFDPERIRSHAKGFSTEIFKKKFRAYVDSRWAEHQQTLKTPIEELR